MSARDVVAKEVCCAGDCINADSPGPLPCFGLRHAANRADRILSTLAAAGYAVVPVREITELRDQVNAYACDLRAISAVARRQGEIIAAARETKA